MTVDDAQGSAEIASWGRRLAAVLVDGLLLAFLVLFTMLAAGVPLQEVNDSILGGSSWTTIALFVLPEAIYDTWMVGSRSQTFGKMLLGIKVVGADDRAPIGYARAFTRWVSTATLWALWLVPGLVDHLWPLRDRRNQTLHDKFARSLVVRA